MLRPHVDDELIAVEKSFVGLIELEVREIPVGIG
jgi:hypothetical protein